MITIFENMGAIDKPNYITIEQALDRIKSGRSKSRVDKIRKKIGSGDDSYEVDKKALPFVVFSAGATKSVQSKKGYITHREDDSVTIHSGFFIIDFDKCDVEQQLEQLRNDPYIYACWVAPSGRGVKGLVKCPPSLENHNLYYTAFLDRYPSLDPTSRNISRGTFESYDPNIFVNYESIVWDKRMTEEERRKNKEKNQNRRGTKVISVAVAMVRSSYDGTKHDSLRNAAVLLGGYIATGRVNEDEAIKVLEEEILAKNPKDFDSAKQTIRDGIEYGKSRPLHDAKKIEKAQEFLRTESGEYDFMADYSEMDEYLRAVINGTLEQGLPTGMNELNPHWMLKKNHLVFWVALDNVGKSFFVWYVCVLAAMLHGWRIIINSNENSDGELRKKLMEYYMGKSVKLMDDEEITIANDFVKKHFRIVSSKNLHTLPDFLLKCEVIIDEGFEADVVVADPYNSFDISIDSMYTNTLKSLNVLRVFKENYCSVYMIDHVGTQAARKKDKNGYVEVPWKSDVDMGQLKCSKTDDFVILHRWINHPEQRYDLQVHVAKIKSVETGGFPTQKDEPVTIQINADYCGYTCYGTDPVKHYWKHKNQQTI